MASSERHHSNKPLWDIFSKNVPHYLSIKWFMIPWVVFYSLVTTVYAQLQVKKMLLLTLSIFALSYWHILNYSVSILNRTRISYKRSLLTDCLRYCEEIHDLIVQADRSTACLIALFNTLASLRWKWIMEVCLSGYLFTQHSK